MITLDFSMSRNEFSILKENEYYVEARKSGVIMIVMRMMYDVVYFFEIVNFTLMFKLECDSRYNKFKEKTFDRNSIFATFKTFQELISYCRLDI